MDSMNIRTARAAALVEQMLGGTPLPQDSQFTLKLKDVAKALDVRFGIEANVEHSGKLVVDLPDETSLWFGDDNGPIGYSHVHSDGQALLGAEDDGPDADDPTDELIRYVLSVVNLKISELPSHRP